MQCFTNGTCVKRPEIHCAFNVMDRCEIYFENKKQKNACVEGARDAHLLSFHIPRFSTQAEKKAYESGQYTTYTDCQYPTLFIQ
jgi:hypothetical protein